MDHQPGSCPRMWNRDLAAVLNFKHIVDGLHETGEAPRRFVRVKILLNESSLVVAAAGAVVARGQLQQQLPSLVSGQTYAADEVRHVHALVRRYMRYATAATSFVELSTGWAGCGLACQGPDVRNAILNMTWHVDAPLSDGLVAVHHESKEIVVAWAGTHRYRALLLDMAVFPQPYIPGTGINVHGGFLASVRGAVARVGQHLERLMGDYPEYAVVFTGHSKGGAEAALSALDLVRSIAGLRGRIRVWTFGGPRAGDAQFAALYNQHLGNATYRVVSFADPVVAMPPRLLVDFCHHNLELWLMNAEGDIYVGRSYAGCSEDPRASSSVDFYERSIQWHKNYLGLPPADHAQAAFSW
ncbi:hypothetical protein LPJ61_002889 [Coemansia biformis]|uniref:Fungal lipase-type domain-containing protein n=1 Tax=Coemansia biformis TaxID=1286918 RepID=A0A9W7YD57_9FUNG|nr:hypothetical protein LPJ61_002889 [Coemansia biformis]